MKNRIETTPFISIFIVVLSVFSLSCLSVCIMTICFSKTPSIPLEVGDIVLNLNNDKSVVYSVDVCAISNSDEVYNKNINFITPKEADYYVLRAKVIEESVLGFNLEADVETMENWEKGSDGYYYLLEPIENNTNIGFATGIKNLFKDNAKSIQIMVEAQPVNKEIMQEGIKEVFALNAE